MRMRAQLPQSTFQPIVGNPNGPKRFSPGTPLSPAIARFIVTWT